MKPAFLQLTTCLVTAISLKIHYVITLPNNYTQNVKNILHRCTGKNRILFCAANVFCAACSTKYHPLNSMENNRRFRHFSLNSFNSTDKGWYFTNDVVVPDLQEVRVRHDYIVCKRIKTFSCFSNDLCCDIIDSTKHHWKRWRLKHQNKIAAQNIFAVQNKIRFSPLRCLRFHGVQWIFCQKS